MWHIIHDESITANENLSIWTKDGSDREILFERNSQGLEIAYYHTAFDGIHCCYRSYCIVCLRQLESIY